MWVRKTAAISSGATPKARRFSASLPSAGPMLLPAPASMSADRPESLSRKALTAMCTSPPVVPASRAAWVRSMPRTTSSEVASRPSLNAVTSMSPIFFVCAIMPVSQGPRASAAVGLEINVYLHSHRQRIRLREIDENFDHVDVGHVALAPRADASRLDDGRDEGDLAREFASAQRLGADHGPLSDLDLSHI